MTTLFVGRLYLTHSTATPTIASVCDSKGEYGKNINRLTSFIKETGLPRLVYKSDQESALCKIQKKLSGALGAGAIHLIQRLLILDLCRL